MTKYTYTDFDTWFAEKFGEAGDIKRYTKDMLSAAFYAARIQDHYTLSVEGEGDNTFITLPEEVVKAFNWKEGTVVEWTPNGDGSAWTLKEK